MKLLTEIPIPPSAAPLDPHKPILLIGSCFTSNIGDAMRNAFWDAAVNPCGVQYNPLSMASLISAALEGTLPAGSLFDYQGLWRNWLMPTTFSAPTAEAAAGKAAEALAVLRQYLASAQAIFVTFGTANIYEHIPARAGEWEGVVANCHKVPASQFKSRLASVSEIVDCWQQIMALIRKINARVRFIFTVSPIRHLRPSARVNTISKATLHLAVEELTQGCEAAEYFPAWEILTDELRDYRFYASDLTHPSEVAVDYIREKFQQCYLTTASQQVLAQGAALTRRHMHRPLTASEIEIASFREETERLTAAFLAMHPGMRAPF
jgi:lysophospholipase L1-like esterase